MLRSALPAASLLSALVLGCGDNLSAAGHDAAVDGGPTDDASIDAGADAGRDGGGGNPPPSFDFACPPTGDITPASLRLNRVATGLAQPLFATAPAGDDRLFIVEQPGRIKVIDGGVLQATPYLDIATRVKDNGSEQGLLGLAFHPNFAANGKFYVNYTRDVMNQSQDETVIAEYTAENADDNTVDPGTEVVLLTVTQPYSNHNGGMLSFGPDGMLYIGMGDGGDAGDPLESGQDSDTLLGALLRIDVDNPDRGKSYGVPDDNPFTGGSAPEVYAIGLRNPWRYAFDSTSSRIYIADVGQNRVEEVNALALADLSGANFGWDEYEGDECFNEGGNYNLPGSGCTLPGTVEPIAVYGHPGSGRADSAGISITGGYVYRGSCLPALQGTYFYADFGTGIVRTLVWDGDSVTDAQDITSSIKTEWTSIGNISSFGVDGAGELYLVGYSGQVYKVGAE